MEFKKVRVCGFNKLYDGVMQYANNPVMKGFGDQLNEFLAHISISYELDDLSSMEVYYLNKISSSLMIKNDFFDSFSSREDLVKAERSLIDSVLIMSKDEDVNEFNYKNILPLGSHRYNVIATFQGTAIAFLTTYEFDTIFREDVKDNDGNSVRGPLYETYPGDEVIEDKMAYAFYEKFFEYISNKMTSLDLVTEFMMENKFYKYADKLVNLSSVSCPFGLIDFFGNSKENMKNQMTRVQSGYRTCDIKEDILKHTQLQFVCKTSFEVFMTFVLHYKKYVLNHENFKIIFSKSDFLFDQEILEKYKSHILPQFEKINNYRNSLKEITTIDLNKFNYLFGVDMIRFSISIPLMEISKFAEEFENFGISCKTISADVLKVSNMVFKSIFDSI